MPSESKPTIVLVHGAFADASGWADVFRLLTDRGYAVYAPANPLRGVAGDGEYLRAFVSTIDGPVVLVGHSYGGCVITRGRRFCSRSPTINIGDWARAIMAPTGDHGEPHSTVLLGTPVCVSRRSRLPR